MRCCLCEDTNAVILSEFKNRDRRFLACGYKLCCRHQLWTAVMELLGHRAVVNTAASVQRFQQKLLLPV